MSVLHYETGRLLGRRGTPRSGVLANVRRWYWIFLRRWETEICNQCGRPVGRCTGSWWEADADLWVEINGGFAGVLCPPCFTARCWDAGKPVHWKAVPGV